MRKIFRLDRTTHRYLIEPVSGIQHIKMAMMKRSLKFFETLSNSGKEAVKLVYNTIVNDCRSTTGKNYRLLHLACKSIHATAVEIGKLSFVDVPAGEEWRPGMIKDLINVRDNLCFCDWTKEEATEALHHVCTT